MRYLTGNWVPFWFGILAVFVFSYAAFAAELPIPHPPHPAAVPAERCLTPGEEPLAGQTLHADKRCKSGLRWIFAR
jgi:hypothetical protein